LSEPDAHALLTRWRTAEGWSLPEKKEHQYTDALPSVCYPYFSGFKDLQNYSVHSINLKNSIFVTNDDVNLAKPYSPRRFGKGKKE
jgi:hypothetical protein